MPRRERELIEVLSGQRAFADIVEPSLFQNVESTDDIAARWWPLGRDRQVVLDPGTLFGTPHLAGTRVPTETVAAAIKAEGGGEAAIDAIARWHGISPAAARDALAFQDLMVPAGRLGTCLDESIGAPLAPILRDLSAPGEPDIRSVSELELRGTTDEVLLGELTPRLRRPCHHG